MEKKETISIVVASDNYYALLIAALLKSIDLNHKTSEHIDFHIINDGIAPKSKKWLNSIVDPARITLKWFKSSEIIPAGITIPVDTSAFPLTTYMRVFAPYVIDKDVKKLLYIDVDTIVQGDISNLWNIDIGDNIIGAVQDVGKTVDCAWGGIPNYLNLGLTADTKYFNAGILVINVKKWLDADISTEIITALIKYKDHVRLGDQYGLNVALANKWYELDAKWNWFAHQEDGDPYLIHFLDVKPIFKSYRANEFFKEEFFRYLAMTPWKNFTQISDNNRLIRKIYNKIKKRLMRIFKK